jgi:2,4-dienoyl-CoA reductase-like NADH-dependent reductase (Old Yellow Enzyme family)
MGHDMIARAEPDPLQAENGAANDWHLQHLGSLSLSGAGLVIVEQTAVEPAGRISHGCVAAVDNERCAGPRCHGLNTRPDPR